MICPQILAYGKTLGVQDSKRFHVYCRIDLSDVNDKALNMYSKDVVKGGYCYTTTCEGSINRRSASPARVPDRFVHVVRTTRK